MIQKTVNTTIALALLLLWNTTAIAQEKRRLTLQEAINMSIQNSGQLKIMEARTAGAAATTKDKWNNHLPDVKMSGSYLRLNAPDVSLKIKTGSGTEQNQAPKVDQAAYGSLNVSMPLFAGFRVKYGVESAKYLENATRLDAEKDKQQVVYNAIAAYCNLYKAQNTVDIMQEYLAREKQRVTDFGNLEKNGLMARNDLLKAQLQQANVQLAVIDAESNLRMANLNMNLMLGLPENTTVLPDTTVFQHPGTAGSVAEWEQKALTSRSDITALTLREKAAATGIKAINGEYYPGIAFTGGTIAAHIPNLLTISNAMNAGIGLQYNLGSIWKTGAKVEMAKAQLREVQVAQGMLADQVRLQLHQAYQDYLLSLRRTEVYAIAIVQANENYRITKNKHDNNLTNTSELLEADVAQLQSQLNLTFARIDAALAYKKLELAAGILAN